MKVINLTNKQSRWTVVDLTNTTVQLSGTRRGLCCNLLGDIVRSEMIGRNKDQRNLACPVQLLRVLFGCGC
jgi:hypothetical protein